MPSQNLPRTLDNKEINVPAKTTEGLRWCAWVLCILVFAGGRAYAQQDTGGILVAVTDSAGETVKDAAITVTNNGTQSQLQGNTNDIGTWAATPLPPGNYRVTVVEEGFETAVVEHVVVQIQQNTRLQIALESRQCEPESHRHGPGSFASDRRRLDGANDRGGDERRSSGQRPRLQPFGGTDSGGELLNAIRSARFGERRIRRQRHIAVSEQLCS